MSFLRRLLDSDYRRALSAEAAGDYVEAARHWGLAGRRDKVAEAHLARAERTETLAEEAVALRDALAWADDGTPARARAAARLARVLVRRATSQGSGTTEDREALAEAARLFCEAGEHLEAARQWERLGDDEAAAAAFGEGGLLEEMESALRRVGARAGRTRIVTEAFARYELELSVGERRSALASLTRCADEADDKGPYRRLLADLESRRPAQGRISLARRPGGRPVLVSSVEVAALGRDPDCVLVVPAAGISRRHAELVAGPGGFCLRDGGSRNGTFLSGVAVAGELPVTGEGRIRLGDDAEVAFRESRGVLELEVVRGPARGAVALLSRPGTAIDLETTELGLPATLVFAQGFARLEANAPLRLGDGVVPSGRVELLRGDRLTVGDVEVEAVG